MDWSFLTKNRNAISVSTDTRNLPAGCVFFALHGANFDGNQFALDALKQGASMAVIDDPKYFVGPETVLVPNTLLALQSLAKEWRRTLSIPVIGITGTNGKTTTKELIASVLKTKYLVHYTQGNLNNSIGVPLTLLQLTHQHELAIIEMGASHPGDIHELVEIAEPTCGLITNVGKAHLQGFGSFEGVMNTKKELYDYLRIHHGFIFRNTDNPYLATMAGELHTKPYTTGTMLSGTHLVGDYNSENIQAALCVGECFGVNRNIGEQAIRNYIPSNNRSQRMQTKKNTLIVDAYNANVTSLTAAINAFQGDCLILGDMLELGDYSKAEHQNIVNLIREKGFSEVYLVGSEFAATDAPWHKFASASELHTYLTNNPITHHTILLKGSHGIHLETLIDVL